MGIMLDSIPRGGISLSHLERVSQGVTKNMVTSFEADVDLALIWAYQLEQHPLMPALEPLWGLRMSEESCVFRPNVTTDFGIVTGHFGHRDRPAVSPHRDRPFRDRDRPFRRS